MAALTFGTLSVALALLASSTGGDALLTAKDMAAAQVDRLLGKDKQRAFAPGAADAAGAAGADTSGGPGAQGSAKDGWDDFTSGLQHAHGGEGPAAAGEHAEAQQAKASIAEQANIKAGGTTTTASGGGGGLVSELDLTGDGQRESVGYDTTGDGHVDALDTNGDGRIDARIVHLPAAGELGWDDFSSGLQAPAGEQAAAGQPPSEPAPRPPAAAP